MSYSFISPTGEKIKTKTVKEFAQMYGFRESNARSLACGHYLTLSGWCSGHSSARKKRQRFTTELVNIRTGERKMLGRSITSFARDHGLSACRLSRLVNGSRLWYRDWMLGSAWDHAQDAIPGLNL